MEKNIGYLFYRDYYNKIDLRQFAKSDGTRNKEKHDKVNEFISRGKSKDWTSFDRKNAALLAASNIKDKLFQNINNRLPHSDSFELQTTYPGLLLGTGYMHETGSNGEFKLGFYFDHSTGLPVIPGSSVKGRLRALFPQFKPSKGQALQPQLDTATKKQKNKALYIYLLLKGNKPPKEDVAYAYIHQLEYTLFENWDLKRINENTKSIVYSSSSQRCIFFDALLDIEKNRGKTIFANGSITPHGDNPLKNPTPLLLLKIAPSITWKFYFNIKNTASLSMLDLDSEKIKNLFKEILIQQGVGAKTNVGFGRLVDPNNAYPNTSISEDITDKKLKSQTSIYKLKKGAKVEACLIKIDTVNRSLYFETPETKKNQVEIIAKNVGGFDRYVKEGILQENTKYKVELLKKPRPNEVIQVKIISVKSLGTC